MAFAFFVVVAQLKSYLSAIAPLLYDTVKMVFLIIITTVYVGSNVLIRYQLRTAYVEMFYCDIDVDVEKVVSGLTDNPLCYFYFISYFNPIVSRIRQRMIINQSNEFSQNPFDFACHPQGIECDRAAFRVGTLAAELLHSLIVLVIRLNRYPHRIKSKTLALFFADWR